jgi:tRNA G46 methylase TrmB
VAAFESLSVLIGNEDRPLVLDSGCGTGASSRILAERHPDCLVIGVDKSASRLSRGGMSESPHREENVIWLRADLATFWRLAVQAGWRLAHHYLLYPNPWPKPGHLQRRWHGHPVFPVLLQLGGRLEMRCNWAVYAQEFAAALRWSLSKETPVVLDEVGVEVSSLSPFEAKYRARGDLLYSVTTRLPSGSVKWSTPARLL